MAAREWERSFVGVTRKLGWIGNYDINTCFVLQVKKFLEVEVKPKLKPYEDKLESTVQLELWYWMFLMNLHNDIIDLHDNTFLST